MNQFLTHTNPPSENKSGFEIDMWKILNCKAKSCFSRRSYSQNNSSSIRNNKKNPIAKMTKINKNLQICFAQDRRYAIREPAYLYLYNINGLLVKNNIPFYYDRLGSRNEVKTIFFTAKLRHYIAFVFLLLCIPSASFVNFSPPWLSVLPSPIMGVCFNLLCPQTICKKEEDDFQLMYRLNSTVAYLNRFVNRWNCTVRVNIWEIF